MMAKYCSVESQILYTKKKGLVAYGLHSLQISWEVFLCGIPF